MSYLHLSLEERYYIEIERKKGVSMNKLSAALNRSQSTISRDINRNTGLKGYPLLMAINKQAVLDKSKVKTILNFEF